MQKTTAMQNYSSKFQDPQVREWSYNGFSNSTMLPKGHTLKKNVSYLTKIIQDSTFCQMRRFLKYWCFFLKELLKVGVADVDGGGSWCVSGGTIRDLFALSVQFHCESKNALKK